MLFDASAFASNLTIAGTEIFGLIVATFFAVLTLEVVTIFFR